MCVHGFVSVCVDRDCAHLSPKSECTNSFPVMHSQVKTNKATHDGAGLATARWLPF